MSELKKMTMKYAKAVYGGVASGLVAAAGVAGTQMIDGDTPNWLIVAGWGLVTAVGGGAVVARTTNKEPGS